MKKLLQLIAFSIAIVSLASENLLANPDGYVGRTARTSQGCGNNGCHGTVNNTQPSNLMSGPTTLKPGETGNYTFIVAHQTYARAGCNIAVKTAQNGNTNAGTLTPGTGLQLLSGELTQSTPMALSNGQANFAFTWTAPTTPGIYYLQAIGNARNSQADGVWNWVTPIQIIVAAETNATLTLSSPKASDVFCAGSTLPIIFKASSIATVKIELSQNNGNTWNTVIAPTIIGTDTSYYWQIPANQAAGNTYKIRVSDANNSTMFAVSDAFGIGGTPRIMQQPRNTTGCAGQSVNLTVTAQGAGLQYQWMKDGAVISGANAAQYQIPAATPADAGSYLCMISSTCGSVTSSAATVVIGGAPQITSQPNSVTTTEGNQVIFEVQATGANLQYQWRKNGINLTGAGSRQFRYTITAVKQADSGSYDCLINSQCGNSTSAVATLVVTPSTSGVLSAQALTLNFGQVLIGTTREASVTLANVGVQSLAIENSYFSNPVFEDANTSKVTIPVGGNSPFAVKFTPKVRGNVTGTLRFGGDFAGTSLTITLVGRGLGVEFTATSQTFYFGTINKGLVTTQTIALRNSGDFNAVVDSVSFTKTSGSEAFSVKSRTPVNVTDSVNRNAQLSLVVAFSPKEYGNYIETMTAWSGGRRVAETIVFGVSAAPTGVDESVAEESTAIVYPNPATDVATLLINSASSVEISLVDMRGNTEATINSLFAGQNSRSVDMSLRGLHSGMYRVVVREASGRVLSLPLVVLP